jgi:hypothetical protein
MSNNTKKYSTLLWFLLPLLLLVIVFSYLYKEKYLSCISKDFSLCINSKKYTSVSNKFSFRYPKDYPLTFASEEDMNKRGWSGRYAEWINFSTEFYPNAGGDRLGSVIIEKNTAFKDVKEYVDKELSYFEVPPNIEYLKISGQDAVCSSLKQQPHSFNSPSYGCYIVYQGQLYIIGFDYNDYYHKLPIRYYEQAREIILSTFSFN